MRVWECMCGLNREAAFWMEKTESRWSVRGSNNWANTKSRGHSGLKPWAQILKYPFISLEVGKLVATSTNRVWQKGCYVTSKARSSWPRSNTWSRSQSWAAMLDGPPVGFSRWAQVESSLLSIPAQAADIWVKKVPDKSNPSHSNHPKPNKSFQLGLQT